MIRKESILAVALLALGLAMPCFASDSARTTSPPMSQPQLGNDVLRLEDVVRVAVERNPALQSAAHMVEAQRRRVPQAKALPDPSVSIGWMGNAQPFSVQTGDPSSYRSVSAMQMLPFPGKLRLRGEMAGKDADAAQWDVEAQRRRVVAEVKTAFYDYFFYEKAIQSMQRNRELLEKLSQIAEARYRVGKAVQQDVLKSQVEVSLLLQKLTTLEAQRDIARARLNTLMLRSPESPLPPPAEVEASGLSYSLDELYKLARQNDTELQRDARLIERNQLAANLAQKDALPDLSVGYMYQQRPEMPDMHGMTFSVSIPVFYGNKQKQAIQQAVEERAASERSRDNRQNELFFELKQNYLAAKASDQLLKLYAQGVVPQSSLALESSMSAYQVGNVDFLTVLGNFTTVNNYEVEYFRELANHQTTLARMEALVGVDLTSAQPAPTGAPQGPGRK
ncbi:MAG: TolC family protein [Acidobacteriia bacterium]|nr:TolC family protein [Terriglobia bacterium]